MRASLCGDGSTQIIFQLSPSRGQSWGFSSPFPLHLTPLHSIPSLEALN